MGTSSNESSPKVSEHETRTNGDLKESSPVAAAANELDSVASSKNLDTSSSSLSHSPLPDSPVEHPRSPTTPSQTDVEGNDELDSNLDTGHEHEEPTAESPASTPDDEMQLFTLGSGDDIYNGNVALSTLSPELTDSTLELGSNAPTTSPPTQVMKRPSGAKYRIPSSVFARSKSNNPDWSCASNESLFSIQMGNMSFVKDDFWKFGETGLKSAELEMIKDGDLDMLRSGELGFTREFELQSGDLGAKNGGLGLATGTSQPELIPEEPVTPTQPSTSSQMFSYSQTPNMATTNSGKTAELGVAIETMKEVIREAANHKSKNSISDGSVAGTTNNRSSTESFAFSSGADNSIRVGSTVKPDRGSPPSPTQSTPQPKKEQEPKSPAAALQTAKTGWSSWMSCYWCRPYCCL